MPLSEPELQYQRLEPSAPLPPPPSEPPPMSRSEGCCSACFRSVAIIFQSKEPLDARSRADSPSSYQTAYQAPVVIPPAVAMSSTDTRMSEKNRLLPHKLQSSAPVASNTRREETRQEGPSASSALPGDHSSDQCGPSSSGGDQDRTSSPAPSDPHLKPGTVGPAAAAAAAAGHRRSPSLGPSDKKPAHRRTTSQTSQDKDKDKDKDRPGHKRNTSKTAAVRGSSGSGATEAVLSFGAPAGKPLVPQDEDDDFCPTCLEVYVPENPKIWTECGHHFHMPCIFEWMERKDTCPICESKMSFPGLT